MMRHDSLFAFRAGVCALAALVGGLAIWVIAAEVFSPRLIYFPTNSNEAEALSADQSSATAAAVVGLVRGDLWTAAAITRASPLLFEPPGSSPVQGSQADVEHAHAMAERAATLSPHDSRIWLVLADLNVRNGGSRSKTVEALKLSYYTGPNELSLMPLRLLLVVQSDAISDEELQTLVPLDVERIDMQRPDLKPAIALAYKNSLPKGREIIKAALEQADPSFLAMIVAPPR
jgi:hypothetical protein